MPKVVCTINFYYFSPNKAAEVIINNFAFALLHSGSILNILVPKLDLQDHKELLTVITEHERRRLNVLPAPFRNTLLEKYIVEKPIGATLCHLHIAIKGLFLISGNILSSCHFASLDVLRAHVVNEVRKVLREACE